MGFRTVIGAAILAGIGLLIYLDQLLFSPYRPLGSLLLAAVGVLGWGELARMSGVRGTGPRRSRGLDLLGTAGIVYFFAVAWAFALPAAGGPRLLPGAEADWVLGGVAAILLATFSVAMVQEDLTAAHAALLETVLGVLLLGLLFSYALRIYLIPGWMGPVTSAVFLAGVKGNDTTAYYVGKAWGKRKLLKVSPKKTLEGSLGALAFSAVYFAAVAALSGPHGSLFPWWGGILFGMMFSIVSQLGDLAESLLKRVYQVKDSGAILPEFGGVLDMIDSLIFTGFLFWTGVQAVPAPG